MKISETTLTTNLTAVTDRQNNSKKSGIKMKCTILQNRQYILIVALFFWNNVSFAYYDSATSVLAPPVSAECIDSSQNSISGFNFSHCSSITVIASSQSIPPKFKVESPDNNFIDHYQFYLYQPIKKPPRFSFTPHQQLEPA